jgi:hypothetical protein
MATPTWYEDSPSLERDLSANPTSQDLWTLPTRAAFATHDPFLPRTGHKIGRSLLKPACMISFRTDARARKGKLRNPRNNCGRSYRARIGVSAILPRRNPSSVRAFSGQTYRRLAQNRARNRSIALVRYCFNHTISPESVNSQERYAAWCLQTLPGEQRSSGQPSHATLAVQKGAKFRLERQSRPGCGNDIGTPPNLPPGYGLRSLP